MRIEIKRQLHIWYLIIITYNIVIVHCNIWDDDGLNVVSDVPDTLLRMLNMESTMDGSGDTSKINLFIIKNLMRYFR
jgi:hypothetical protein